MRALLIFLILLSASAYAQSSKLDFKSEVLKLNNQGMAFAGGWSLGNMAYSGTELVTLSFNDPKNSEAMYRSQMNLAWSGINTAIFGLAYWGQNKLAKKDDIDWYKQQKKYQNSFMINTFLDVLYIGGGYWLSQRTKGDLAQNQGFGQAIMFQGSFLLGYDAIIWYKHYRLRKRSKLPKLD